MLATRTRWARLGTQTRRPIRLSRLAAWQLSPRCLRMRLGMYGWVANDLGGCEGGHYLVIKELLLRGHEVDFFTELAQPLIDHPAFTVVPLPRRLVTTFGGHHPSGPVLHGMDVVTTSTAMRRFGA